MIKRRLLRDVCAFWNLELSLFICYMIQYQFAAPWDDLLCDSLHTRKLDIKHILDLDHRIKKTSGVEADQTCRTVKTPNTKPERPFYSVINLHVELTISWEVNW